MVCMQYTRAEMEKNMIFLGGVYYMLDMRRLETRTRILLSLQAPTVEGSVCLG